MKKFVSIIAILLMLSLAACSNQDTPSAADNPSNTQTESNTMLDAGVWPVNEYTEGLPVPSGTVGWAMLDTEHENCSISIVDISETDYNDYLELLKQEGFSIIEEVSEEIEGQDYVSIGTLLSNGEKGLSISYIPDIKMVESKSLKLYLFSFRNHGAFHEDCVNIIMKDLIKLMNPKYIEVTGIFTPRGGISIYPYANYGRPGTKFEQMAEHRLMNRE